MRKKTTANIVKPSRWREYLSITLFVCAILLSFALLSYNNSESNDASPPQECTNAVGTVGLTTAHWLFKILGVSVYIFPVLLISFAVMLFMRFAFPKVKNLVLRLLALFGLLITSSCLADIFYSSNVKFLNIDSAGGMLGKFINDSFLRQYFGNIGATTVLLGMALILVLFLFDTSLKNGWYLLLWLRNAIVWICQKTYLFIKWLGIKIYTSIIAVTSNLKERFAKRKMREQSNIKTVIVVTGDKNKRKKKNNIAAVEPVQEQNVQIQEKPIESETSVPVSHQEINEKVEKEIEEILPPFEIPSLDSLDDPADDDIGELEQEAAATTEKLKETFVEFDVKADVGNVICGPVITCYEVHPAPGVKVKKITGLENEIAMAMQAKSIRIVAPIPGKDAVGIELPNETRRMVTYSQLVHTDKYDRASKKMTLPLSLGQTIDGEAFIDDLTKMPHLLVAGATNSGKSVCINTILMSILLKFKPNELKLILVDPKHVELVPYHNLPHLLFPVLNSPEKVPDALEWLIEEMSLRYKYFARFGVRNIDMFNKKRKEDKRPLEIKAGAETRDVPEFLPLIVIVIDELADLMMVAKAEVEARIIRLAQLARAAGIHMIIATQRPSTNVITGLIKANIPARIAFRTTSNIDSRVILDQMGSEKLLGSGDMLYKSPNASSVVRLQGAFVSEDEVRNVTDFIREQRQPDYVDLEIVKAKQQNEEVFHDDKIDEAIRVVVSSGQASASYLQRSLRVGYARAASLIDIMEVKGIVGPKKGSKPREILITPEDLPPIA
ncbi:DNA translocase FtsK 4TM domain-containing protein [bacterium]|nr:DNA translocase FtsK 4TM domain-containing protein [bacterium]